MDQPWDCSSCIKKQLQKRRNCGGLIREEKSSHELVSPSETVFSAHHPLIALDYKDLWIDSCPLNYHFRRSGGIDPNVLNQFKLAGAFRNKHLLPYSGGLLDQPAALMDSLELISGEQDRIENDKVKIEKARMKADRAFQNSKRR
tara:strand:+ start:26047 stop:26481 length:435 start_codon:yes stop_codon:yes gene_type:complete